MPVKKYVKADKTVETTNSFDQIQETEVGEYPAKTQDQGGYQVALSNDELLSLYHAARALEDNVVNNVSAKGLANTVEGLARRECLAAGIKECTNFDLQGNCTNPTCEDGLHAA